MTVGQTPGIIAYREAQWQAENGYVQHFPPMIR
jgi:hypothetical protein